MKMVYHLLNKSSDWSGLAFQEGEFHNLGVVTEKAPSHVPVSFLFPSYKI